VVLGLDPGFRTGCKVAVVDGSGKVLATTTIYPMRRRTSRRAALEILIRLTQQTERYADRHRQRHRVA
jgi:uncharacterized protein